jgi:hypothetical protein
MAHKTTLKKLYAEGWEDLEECTIQLTLKKGNQRIYWCTCHHKILLKTELVNGKIKIL